ncbi:Major facilitator superfamily domain general substrate transporter [Penicillium taxi]|uniref:Major facilitator superfamily domain general substrate transporter n=1 Tax=Penicillium taxi TaxID=168475 RepID=UPI00254577F3|nr:Major facilitator superfamily domain general substrate transporter [Penicillium taxi]KAJ5894295.1 Major facilitator superfamily domain general substrate transporter [Penicillium taxi]
MSNPPPVFEEALPRPLVTPAAPTQHDCSEEAESCPTGSRHHFLQDQLLSQGARQAPSPSRAESPTVHQWSQPVSSFSIKRSSTIPLEKFTHPPSIHSPQLSERDSIFATHYLPSDSAATTPQLRPEQASNNERQVNSIPSLDEVPASPTPAPKVSSLRSYVDPSHMEVDVRRHNPLRSSLLSSEVSHLSLLRASISSSDQAKRQELHTKPPSSHQLPSGEKGTKPSGPQDSPAERSLLPSPLGDVFNSPIELTFPHVGLDKLKDDSQGGSQLPPTEHSRGTTVERSTSKSRRGRGRVDNSIEADLTNVEPVINVRSRKSSHYLGLFKENTSPDRKRREDRERQQDEASEPTRRAMEHDIQNQSVSLEEEGPVHKSRSLPSFLDGSFDDVPVKVTEQDGHLGRHPPPPLPRSLLEEIRNFHLTPGGDHGSSFSKSIPAQYSERGREYFQKEPNAKPFSESLSSVEPIDSQDLILNENEVENEHIKSAVYFPHKRIPPNDESDFEKPLVPDSHSVKPATEQDHGVMLVPHDRDISEEQEVGHVDISFWSRNENRVLHGDLQDLRSQTGSVSETSLGPISERSYDSACESDTLSSTEGSVRSAHEDWEDDAEATPTATPTQRSHFPLSHKPTGPLGSVELKPYRHQVGGHTTVFRFSRRAVCKQLNNRENEFYERIERRHPEILRFLPRYIGVLNVTFSKNAKRAKDAVENAGVNPEDQNQTTAEEINSKMLEEPAPQRIVSQSQVTGVIPKVILENNRHIIPADLFSRPQRPRLLNDPIMNRPHSADELGGFSSDSDPCSNKRPKIWGATTVNTKLQEQVLREVFSPPAIHHHRRHARGHLSRATSDIPHRRGIASEDHGSNGRLSGLSKVQSLQSPAMDIPPSTQDVPPLSSSASTALDKKRDRMERVQTEDEEGEKNSADRGQSVRRRHSGGGLQRRGSINSRNTAGELLFFEDEGYGGDKEDEIFSMDGDTQTLSDHFPSAEPSTPPSPRDISSLETAPPTKLSLAVTQMASKDDVGSHLPNNPKEAQKVNEDEERVQLFLLLEDLTAGMNKPCVLDLKMGTRQYGIEANEKKRRVRLCGMQAWNVKKQEYIFEDKYFGRDLKSGREFQDALTRFLYDGVSYVSVAKKIPVILEKLSLLENMVRRLENYRLYASSLLILYDGEPSNDPPANPRRTKDRPAGPQRRASEEDHSKVGVQLKIVDFANCVTGEDELPPDTPCPPYHPGDIDRGYLRGLRTLRMYFQRIMKEITKDDVLERGEGEATALGFQPAVRESPSNQYLDENVMDSDPGEVSF